MRHVPSDAQLAVPPFSLQRFVQLPQVCRGGEIGLAAVEHVAVAVVVARVAAGRADAVVADALRVGRRAALAARPAVSLGRGEIRFAAVRRVAVAVAEATIATRRALAVHAARRTVLVRALVAAARRSGQASVERRVSQPVATSSSQSS